MFPRANVFSHKDGQPEHLFQHTLPHTVSQQRRIEAHLNVTNFIGPPMNVPRLVPKYQWNPVKQPDVLSSPNGVKGSNRNFIGPPMNFPRLIPKNQWNPVKQPDVSSSPNGVKGSNRKRRRDDHSQNDLKRQRYGSPGPRNQPSRNADFTSQPATAPVTSRETSSSSSSVPTCSSATSKLGSCVPSLREGSHQSASPPSSVNDKLATAPVTSRETSSSSSSVPTCSSATSKLGGCVPSLREGSHQSASPPSSVNDKLATAPVTSRETSSSSSSVPTCSSAASKPGGCVPSLREGSHQSTSLPSSVNDKLSQQILDLFHACEQQNIDLEKKEYCRAALQRDIQTIFPCAQVFMAGSSLNGFGSRSSDADLCLFIQKGTEIHKKTAICVLGCVQKLFNTLYYIERPKLIRAKVPILKFRDRVSGVEFDLNVNNTVGIRNTFLLRTYAYVEKRVRPIILVIKKWASHHGINDASQGTLSSYTLVLMVLHYLQTLPEPVIPCLQMDYPECFDPKMDIHLVPSRPSSIPAFVSKNQSSLGDLLLGFLKYYATAFKWDKHVISVREAKTLPRTREWGNKLLCVEEPFNRTNAARAVHNKNKFEVIKAKFTESYQVLQQRKDLNFILPLRNTRHNYHHM